MADKYIIHGATYCGDGTASNAAASAGAAGAWNDINVFEGTAPAYGTAPAAGDVITIRSKTSAGADITRTTAATITIGSAAATSTVPVTWIIDGGIVWPGVSGKITYNATSTFVVNTRNYNFYFADMPDALSIVESNAAATYKQYNVGIATRTKNMLYNLTAPVSWSGSYIGNVFGVSVWENFHLRAGSADPCFIGSIYGVLTLINPEIELTRSVTGLSIFRVSTDGAVKIFGGRVWGAGATTGAIIFLIVTPHNSIRCVGTQWPRAMTVCSYSGATSLTSKVEAVGLDGGIGAMISDAWGFADSRSDSYYPTLNAAFPNSNNEPWSWKLYAPTGGVFAPIDLPVAKIFTEESAIKEIALDLLIADAFPGVDKSTLWMDVQYIDAGTGLPKSISTRVFAGGVLATSTAAWTLTTYGPVNLLKRKLAIVTPSEIKKDTMVIATLRGTLKSVSADDVLFMCPDVVLS